MISCISSLSSISKGLLAGNFLMSKAGKQAMQWILGFVTSLQIIAYLPLMAVVMPANVVAFYKILVPLVTMDFIDDHHIEYFFTFDTNDTLKYENPTLDQAVEMGYETHNSLQNLKTVGLMIVIYHIKMAIYPCLSYKCCQNNQVCGKCVESWQIGFSRKLFYTEIIVLLLIGYFEIVISGYFTW